MFQPTECVSTRTQNIRCISHFLNYITVHKFLNLVLNYRYIYFHIKILKHVFKRLGIDVGANRAIATRTRCRDGGSISDFNNDLFEENNRLQSGSTPVDMHMGASCARPRITAD